MDNRFLISGASPFRFIFIFALLIFLTSCSTRVAHRDGAPNFYVDETKIPNAVPKQEPLAKYGNMKFYNVFGKRYYPMQSSKNYEQTGIASWYGTQFHARRTSSGELYNMLGMTAAHKTLPLPTYVEVTNLKNHRTIIVKVNDRGPFESTRLIDLSYVAAKKLGMLGHGTALVHVKAIDPRTFGKPKDFYLAKRAKSSIERFSEIKHPPTIEASREPYWRNKVHYKPGVYLQVGAFRSRANAEKLRSRLVTLCEAPVNVSAPAKGRLYRVHVGPIKNGAIANKITARLKNLGIKTNKTNGV